MKIPVVVAAGVLPEPLAGDEIIRLARPIHAHDAGDECVACAAIGDVRVSLYELLEARRLSGEPLPERVVVDASGLDDVQLTIDRVAGKAPAGAMRDHVVARNFVLAP
jgi:hypothetical protein